MDEKNDINRTMKIFDDGETYWIGESKESVEALIEKEYGLDGSDLREISGDALDQHWYKDDLSDPDSGKRTFREQLAIRATEGNLPDVFAERNW